MMDPQWMVTFASDSSLMIRNGLKREAQPFPLQAVLTRLQGLDEIGSSIENFHPAYQSLLVDFDPERTDPNGLQTKIKKALQSIDWSLDLKPAPAGRLVEIPVVYGGEEGPDLDEVAQRTGMSPNEIIRAHSESTYDVAFLGFSPGFPYLLGLSKQLHCARKATPRLRVPAGSVAIGGTQTGIYPEEGPGGWQIIGRAQIRLFDPAHEPPTILAPGDRLRFKPVARPVTRAETP